MILLIIKTEEVPECLNSDYNYWTMSGIEDTNDAVYIVNREGAVSGYHYSDYGSERYRNHVYEQNAIRPVINLKKCALTNTCE